METSALTRWPIQDAYAPPINIIKVEEVQGIYNETPYICKSKRVICFNHWIQELQNSKAKTVLYYSLEGTPVIAGGFDDTPEYNHIMHIARYCIIEHYD